MSEHETETAEAPESVAVIGLACRFPGADDPETFWQNLRDGVSSVVHFTDEELLAAGEDPALIAHPDYVKVGAVLNDIESFDAAFFRMSPKEAAATDPQHRVFLECAWEALESAGWDPAAFHGRIGVFAGSGFNTYLLRNMIPNRDFMRSLDDYQIGIGNNKDFVATRVSYQFDLKGPGVNVGTACSTSLVAVHLACQSLLSFSSDMALAGAATIRVPQRQGYLYREGGIPAPDGICRPFDAKAKGTLNSSGVGVVLLKRLADALDDGDTIHAVIRGTAINNDGSGKVGFTAPSVEGQAEVIAEAHAVAEITPDAVSYVEAHGTGTALGDPIEIEALNRAFGVVSQKGSSCAIGSVKSNIGHTDTASGMAGLIKAVLSMGHGRIPPSLHFHTPNPRIDFAGGPFTVNTQLREWPAGSEPRMAGVSSFGIGGTNVHLVLEETPPSPTKLSDPKVRQWYLLTLSARTASALDRMTQNLSDHLRRHPETDLADAAYTLQIGRRDFTHRRVLLCDRIHEDQGLVPARVLTPLHLPGAGNVVFMFPGQGAQYVNMGLELYRNEPAFREAMDRCAEILLDPLGRDIRQIIYPEKGDGAQAEARLRQTEYAQPAIFAVSYAAAQLWMSWGIRPRVMIGHSIGEYAAACIAGVFSLEDALSLVAHRARLMQGTAPGKMLAVALPEAELLPLPAGKIAVAAVNGPAGCVISGPADEIESFEKRLVSEGIGYRPLHTSHAFHSALMDPVAGPFEAAVKKIPLSPPKIPFISDVTGERIEAAAATDPAYWARHLRETVRFNDGIETLFSSTEDIFLETGPGTTLTAFVNRHPDRPPGRIPLASVRHPRDDQPDTLFLLTTLGNLWLSGAPVDWKAFHRGMQRQRIPLPTYPFERQRHWVDPPGSVSVKSKPAPEAEEAEEKRYDFDQWFHVPTWHPAPALSAAPLSPAAWLLLTDGDGWGDRIARHLTERGHSVIRVAPGEAFSHDPDEARYTVDLKDGGDLDRLMAELAGSDRLPERIILCRRLSPDPVSDADPSTPSPETAFYSLLFLAQALGRHAADHSIQIDVIAGAVHRVTGREAQLYPRTATLLGPVRTIPQEYPNIRCNLIDVAPEEPAESLLNQLMAELSADAGDGLVALRENRRWLHDFEPVRPETAISGKLPARLREEGVYLITGGLGGIGSVLARYLAETVRAKLVLVSRSSLPDRSSWAEWLSVMGPSDPTTGRIRLIRELESFGAEVLIPAADVSDPKAMTAAVELTRERFGPINGVIHAAGLPSGGVIQRKTRQAVEATLAPKVQGTLSLDRAIGNAPLDFLLLCSSLTSVVGGFGQVDYCAANAFLDAFAHARTARTGEFTVSVNWDTWQEVGMAVDAASGRMDAPAERSCPPGFRPQIEKTANPLFQWRVRPLPDQEIRISRFGPADMWMLAEHRVLDQPTLPGTAYIEMAYAAFSDPDSDRTGTIVLENVYLLRPLAVEEGSKKEIRTILRRTEAGTAAFSIVSRANGREEWQEHASGQIGPAHAGPGTVHDIRAIENRCREAVDMSHVAEKGLGQGAIRFGPRWNVLRDFRVGDNEALARLELPERFAEDLSAHPLHPALLDIACASLGHRERFEGLPFHYRRMIVERPLPRIIYSHIRQVSAAGDKDLTFDITITDEAGAECLRVEGYTLRRVRQPASIENFALSIDAPGDLNSLRFIPLPRKTPGPEEVEIEVAAAGLNFKEVLYAAGLFPGIGDQPVRFGMECAGRITAVGENVTDFSPGDPVAAFAQGAFGAYVVTPAAMVAAAPEPIDMEDAAASPVAFMTAYYALVRLGRLARGERVLIHAASGGVGMAAVIIAQWIGAEIFATAGSPEKREFLRSRGIRHVMDSRALSFADEILAQTDGQGVDVLLNSLPEPYISKGLSILKPYGRFLELGVKDIHEDTPLGLKPFEKNLSFFAIDLDPRLPDFTALFREVMGLLDAKTLSPLPKTVYPIQAAGEAFQQMAGAKHIGKIVFSLAERASIAATLRVDEPPPKAVTAGSTPARARAFQDEFIRQGIHPSEGIRAFARILESGENGFPDTAQVAVSPRDLKARIAREGKVILERMGHGKSAGPVSRRPELQRDYVAPETEIEKALARIWQELLGIDRVGTEDDFFELGGDSLLAVQVLSKVKEQLGPDLSVGILFDTPTISTLAHTVAKEKNR